MIPIPPRRRRPLAVLILLLVAALPMAAQEAEIDARISRLEAEIAELKNARKESVTDQFMGTSIEFEPVEECETSSDPMAVECCPPEEEDSEPVFSMKWKYGLEFESKDKAFRFHVGGRTHIDTGWNWAPEDVQFGPGGIGELQDGIVVRRARLRADGSMYEIIDWVVEYEFATLINNSTTGGFSPATTIGFTDVYATVKELPLIQNLRGGVIKEPIGFDHLTSSRWLNFMERGQGFDAFFERGSGGFTPGLMMFQHYLDNRFSTWLGVFGDTNRPYGFSFGDDNIAVTGRIAGLPIYQDDGKRLLHLGVAASQRGLYNDSVRLRVRPSVRTEPGAVEPTLADTGVLGASGQQLFDVELASVLGSWTLVSEYYCSQVQDVIFPFNQAAPGVPIGNAFYQGGYVEILYFLTGEYRAYNLSSMNLDRIIPKKNFSLKSGSRRGWGAWQVGGRYGYIDLQDLGINGATLHDATFGINWIWNPNTRIYFNYAYNYREPTPAGSAGSTNYFGMRFAFDF